MDSIYQKKQKASFYPSNIKTTNNSSFQYQDFPVQTKTDNQQQGKNQDLSGYKKPKSSDIIGIMILLIFHDTITQLFTIKNC